MRSKGHTIMQRRSVWLVVLGLLALSVMIGVHSFAANPNGADIGWHGDLNQAHQLSVSTGKPMLIVFHASWCGFCTKLERQTLHHPGDFPEAEAAADQVLSLPIFAELKAEQQEVVVRGIAKALGRISTGAGSPLLPAPLYCSEQSKHAA